MPPPSDMDSLHFYAAFVDGTTMTQDTRVSDLAVSVKGRNLGSDPYDLLIKEDSHAGPARQMSLAVVGFRGGTAVAFGVLADPPQVFVSGKVVGRTVTLKALGSQSQPFELLPNKCIRIGNVTFGAWNDKDCDGYLANVDCNDRDPRVHPGATEICANGIDDNCNGVIDEAVDADGDGYTNCGGDCDDADADVHPGATEVCDGKDNNCNGACDEGFDKDGDGYTTCGTTHDAGSMACKDKDPKPELVDCNDNRAEVHPDATEVCDGLDNNCDGTCDEGFDKDGDGFTTCGSKAQLGAACLDRLSSALIDCNDDDRNVNPAAKEICDGKDDNCDGVFYPPHEVCFAANGAECRIGSRNCADMPPGTGYAATCTTDVTGQPAPAAICSLYASCATNPSPILCTMTKAAMTTGQKVVTCTVDFMAGGTICPSATEQLPVPSGANGNCLWSLFTGLTAQGPYTVGFVTGGTALAPTSMSCDSQLAIGGYNGSTPQQRLVFLTLDAGGPTATRTSYTVDLQPNIVATCGSDALHCNFAP